jgi:hypothetical protein
VAVLSFVHQVNDAVAPVLFVGQYAPSVIVMDDVGGVPVTALAQ